MNNLVQSQIHESCKLSLPEGLKDLMSDISREVLRAQPQNLYQFIANYLEALLHAREVLTIACQICEQTCECTCEPALESELRTIGLDEKDVYNAIEIIMDHFTRRSVHEQNLFLKTSIDEDQISAVQEAVQKAFKRKLINTLEGRNKHEDNAANAVRYTIQLYDQNKTKTEKLFIPSQSEPYGNTDSTTSLAGSYIQHVGFAQDFDQPKQSNNQIINEEFNENRVINYENNETDNIESLQSENISEDIVCEDIEEEINFENKEDSITTASSIDESISNLGDIDAL